MASCFLLLLHFSSLEEKPSKRDTTLKPFGCETLPPAWLAEMNSVYASKADSPLYLGLSQSIFKGKMLT